jgi:hypothetical protein
MTVLCLNDLVAEVQEGLYDIDPNAGVVLSESADHCKASLHAIDSRHGCVEPPF